MSALLKAAFPAPEKIADDVRREGFAIYPEAIDGALIDALRDYWLKHFSERLAARDVARGNLVVGEPNFTSFSDKSFWKLYRYFGFLWNRPDHEPTHRLCVELHRRRNLAQGFPEDYGLSYDPQCYSFYVAVNYYLPGGGFVEPHVDAHRGEHPHPTDLPLLHFMVPLTFKGSDYREGGMVVYDRAGARIDVESRLERGGIIFFDARLRHGVEPVEPALGSTMGRLSVFAIPTFFKKLEDVPAAFLDAKSLWSRGYRFVRRARRAAARRRGSAAT